MNNQNTNGKERKFLAVSAQTWIWVVLLVAAIPIVNFYGVPILFGIAVLLLLGFTFWKSGRAVREENSFRSPQSGLKTNVHSIHQRNLKKAK